MPNPESTANIIERMRLVLVPKGTADVVLLRVGRNHNFIQRSSAEVKQAIDDVEKLIINVQLGHIPTEPEKLGIQVLMDSAGCNG